ncbi:uncharacterized protein LOC141915395 [Tubulanus polymorphus]|uniref:uncharacterized protein LOC141915395 n=1 Tax=Tubulanus polymorphus TaxID=672921 RepID=UPI003DA358AC
MALQRKPPLPNPRRGRRSSAMLLGIPGKAMDHLASKSPLPLFRTKRSKSVSDGLDDVEGLQSLESKLGIRRERFDVEMILPDGKKRKVTGYSGMTIKDLVQDIIVEYGLTLYNVRCMSQNQILNVDADATLIIGEKLVIDDLTEDNWDPGINVEDDPRLKVIVLFHKSERSYVEHIRNISDVYAEPFRKFTSLSCEDHRLLFAGLGPILSLATLICLRLEDAIDNWDPYFILGNLFSKHFWNQYDDYYASYREVKELLRKKRNTDKEFVEFCKMRRGAARHSLESLLLLPLGEL